MFHALAELGLALSRAGLSAIPSEMYIMISTLDEDDHAERLCSAYCLTIYTVIRFRMQAVYQLACRQLGFGDLSSDL